MNTVVPDRKLRQALLSIPRIDLAVARSGVQGVLGSRTFARGAPLFETLHDHEDCFSTLRNAQRAMVADSSGENGMVPWGGQHIQLVWFLASTDGLDAASLFKRIWGFDADQVQHNRIPNPASPFLSVALAQKDGRLLQAQIQPGRADLIVTAGEPDEPEKAFGLLFNLEETLSELLNRIEETSAIGQDAFRLSVISTFLKPVENYMEAASDLFEFAGFNPEVGEVTDLLVQLNSRKELRGVSVNRLVQLSVFGIQAFSMMLNPGGGQALQTAPMRCASRRYFDFNTVPDGKLLEQPRHIPILRAVATEILRVAASGKLKSLRE